jgi:hypothetical protein
MACILIGFAFHDAGRVWGSMWYSSVSSVIQLAASSRIPCLLISKSMNSQILRCEGVIDPCDNVGPDWRMARAVLIPSFRSQFAVAESGKTFRLHSEQSQRPSTSSNTPSCQQRAFNNNAPTKRRRGTRHKVTQLPENSYNAVLLLILPSNTRLDLNGTLQLIAEFG